MASVEEGVEVAKAKVWSGAMAAKGVEVSTADQYEFRYTQRCGAPCQGPYIMPFRYVMNHNVALHHH